jgi:hypothetical protein
MAVGYWADGVREAGRWHWAGGGGKWAGFTCGLKLRFAINLYGNTVGNFPAQIREP